MVPSWLNKSREHIQHQSFSQLYLNIFMKHQCICLFRILILHHVLEIFLMKKKEMTAIMRQSRKADCSYLLRNKRNNEVPAHT